MQTTVINSDDTLQILDAYSQTIINAVQKAAPAVAHISVTKKRGNPKNNRPEPLGAAGLGFILSSDGYLVTNQHVTGEANDIRISFSNGEAMAGELIGSDPSADLAVQKVHRGDYKPLQFANSANVQQGQIAIAQGNPMGLPHSVTAGVVSACLVTTGNF